MKNTQYEDLQREDDHYRCFLRMFPSALTPHASTFDGGICAKGCLYATDFPASILLRRKQPSLRQLRRPAVYVQRD